MHFDDIVDTYIKKNTDVLNIPKNSLCPYLFTFQEGTPPVLLETVRLQILNCIERIAPYMNIKKWYLTGDCIRPSNPPDNKCEVSVVISFSGYNDDTTSEQRGYEMCRKLSGTYVDRSQHKLYFYMYNTSLSINNLDGAYDVFLNKWVKVPETDDEDFDTDN